MKDAQKEALRWFLQAEDDFRFIGWLQKEGDFFDKGCFIAQQAGEKALKACLYAVGRRRVIGHSLLEMVQDLISVNQRFAAIGPQSRRLDRFYIPTRYPNGLPGGSPFQAYEREDLDAARDDLFKIMEVCRQFLVEAEVLSAGASNASNGGDK